MTTEWTPTPLGDGSFTIISPVNTGELADINETDLRNWIQTHGAVLLRGFDAALPSFTELVQRTSTRLTLDPARHFYSEAAQKVDAGLDKVPLHLENGNFPGCPDLAWFLCETAASQGSATTLCDGKRVWDVMPTRLKTLFLDQDIVYTRRVEKIRWQNFAFHQLPDTQKKGRESSDVVLDEFLALTRQHANVIITPLDHGAIEYKYTASALHTTRTGEIAWANSLLGPSYNYEAPRLSFSDGRELSESLLDELTDLCESVTEEIPWRSGDVAVMDNHRVMHGRREILDANRVIYNALSYL